MRQYSIAVIMPSYNVRGYIEDAIKSVMIQDSERINVELIIVDDGSEDGTINLIKEQMEIYPEKIRLLHQKGGGPGTARNLGLAYVNSDYITFMDSDDLLYRSSYEKLLESALQNDADIVVGNVDRFNSSKEHFASGIHKKIFTNPMLDTHILNYHSLLYDTTSWNKLFKAKFLLENDIKFPENILYEDIPFNMEAHLKSSRTNIITNKVYRWRLRDGNDKSITQSRFEMKNLMDRITAMKLFNSIITKLGINDSEFLESKEFKELTLDFPLYMDHLKDAPTGYADFFREEFLKYKKNMVSNAFEEKLTSRDRLKYFLLEEKRYKKLMDFVPYQWQYQNLPTKNINGKQVFDIEGFKISLKDIPLDVLDVRNDHVLIDKIQKVFFENGKLNILGYAFNKYVDVKKPRNVNMSAKLYSTADPLMEKPLLLKLNKDRKVTNMHGGGSDKYLIKRYHNYDYSSFVITIDLSDKNVLEMLNDGASIQLEVDSGNVINRKALANPAKGKKPRPSSISQKNDLITVGYNSKWELVLQSKQIFGKIDSVDVDQNNNIVLNFDFVLDENATVEIGNFSQEIKYLVPIRQKKAVVDIDRLVDILLNGKVIINGMFDEQSRSFYAGKSFQTKMLHTSEGSLIFKASKANKVEVRYYPSKVSNLVDYQIATNKKNILVSLVVQLGSMTGKIPDLILNNSSNGDTITCKASDHNKTNQGYTLVNYNFTVSNDDLFKFGNSKWYFRLTDSDTNIKYLDNKSTGGVFGNIEYKIYSSGEKNLFFITNLKKSYFDKGPRRKFLLVNKLYPLFRKLPQKKNLVMFEAYWGKKFACNPKAIYEYIQSEHPELTCVWSLNNEKEAISGNGIRVRRFSWQYYYYLARAKYFYNNVNWPDQYVKRSNSVEVQTLHGTFLKTMGLDVADEVNTVKKLEGFRKRHGRWDYLISPSPFMTETAQRVFEFKGTMLEHGFPRNDVLVKYRENKESVDINKLKENLEIPKEKKVIMYAPTYRTRTGFDLKIDLERLKEELGDEYIVLLRLHYFVAKSLDLSDFKGFAWNVSNYPDIQELYLITDILITDYSSVMFDYNILQRPIVFFTYDLEFYRDILRGMYLDFEREAPGPLVKNNEELVRYIKNIEKEYPLYKEKQKEFYKNYNTFEHGTASEMAVEKVLEK